MLILHLTARKNHFKKRSSKYLWINRATGFAVVSLDESFFSFMILSDKKYFWIVEEKKRPIVRITGSHKHIHVFLVP
jgi:hypothetical protein